MCESYVKARVSNRKKLTKSTIDRLELREKMYTVRDSDVPGFSIRVYPNGRKAFFFRYRVGGGRGAQIREPRVGDFGPMTVDHPHVVAKAGWLFVLSGMVGQITVKQV